MEEDEEVKYDEFGFLIDEDTKEYARLPERKQFSREHKWRDLLVEWEDKVIHQPEFINSRVYKGVPHSMRAQVWKTMLDLDAFVSTQPEGFYESLVNEEGKKEHEEQIKLDIPRTFPNHVTLSTPQGREALFRVLKAYSVYNPGVGYCQGMSYVAAVFLMFLSQEESFWMLRIMLTRDHLEGFYNPCMSKLIENSQIFQKLFENYLPLLAKHLATHKIDPLLYVTPWWMCTFTGIPQWDLVLRIWDCFLWEGANATYRFALAFLQMMEDDLLSVDGAEGLLPLLLRPDVSKYGKDKLLKIAICIPIHDLILEAETPREPQNPTATPTKSPRKRKMQEPSRSSSFLGKLIKSFTPAMPIRKRNAQAPESEQPKQRTPRRRKSLNKSRRTPKDCLSPPDATYEQKQFVKEFSTPTPSKGRVRFALGEITPSKFDITGEKPKTPSKNLDDSENSGEEMVEIKEGGRDSLAFLFSNIKV